MAEFNKKDLQDFIIQSKQRLQNILKRLEWSELETLMDYNSNSPACSNKVIVKKSCSPKIASYPDSCITQNSITLESSKLQEILQNPEALAPLNFTQLQANFSREEKLKIYNYVIENTEKLQHFKDNPDAEGELSLADILAQKKREEKRKKRKFRKSKPTHIEEVRNLVELQMQALLQYERDKKKIEQGITATGNNFEENRKRNLYYSKEGDRNQNEKACYGESYRKSKNNERFAEKHQNHGDFSDNYRKSYKDFNYDRKRRSRSRTNERRRRRSRSNQREFIYEKRGYRRSRSRDNSHNETRRERNQSKERSKRNKSPYKEESNNRKRRSTSRKKDYSNERRKRSRSKERLSKRDEKYYDKYYKRYNKSPESSTSTKQKDYYHDKYTLSSSSSRGHSPSKDKYNTHSKHKKKKYKRDHS